MFTSESMIVQPQDKVEIVRAKAGVRECSFRNVVQKAKLGLGYYRLLTFRPYFPRAERYPRSS
jgi:hypothetical protein